MERIHQRLRRRNDDGVLGASHSRLFADKLNHKKAEGIRDPEDKVTFNIFKLIQFRLPAIASDIDGVLYRSRI